jgi:hypothetical protein
MAETTFHIKGTDLASRNTAATERYRLVDVAARHKPVSIDLGEVRTLSYSYADELFGVLTAVKGWTWLVDNVRIVGASEPVLRVIAEVVNRRLKETGQEIRKTA